MIEGEYDAEQAYQAFNAQLLEDDPASEEVVLNSQKSYSNYFHEVAEMHLILSWQIRCVACMGQMC